MTNRIIRTEMRDSDISTGVRALPGTNARALRRALQTLHKLEIMAVNVYKHQMPCRDDSLNRQLISAMANEMSHVQDFQILLYEFGFKPSRLRVAFWIVGVLLGTGSRFAGGKAIPKMGIWTETKAVRHYSALIESIRWDEKTLQILIRDRQDEEEHLAVWKQAAA
jgi:ubiquinone biosynthesis monooxygenase Coq7